MATYIKNELLFFCFSEFFTKKLVRNVCFLLFTAFFLFISKANAQTVTPSANSYELNTNGDTESIRIYLILKDVSFNELNFADKPATVRVGNKEYKTFLNAIKIREDKLLPALDVNVNLTLLPFAGTYEVTVTYSNKGLKNQILQFSIVRPAATLMSLNTLVINKQGDSIRSNEIVLRETGNKGNITSLKLLSPSFGVNNKDLITFPNKPIKIAAGQESKIPYTINPEALKELPIGETKGSIQVYCEQMSASIQVQFQVINKRSSIWIITVVFAGLILGSLVRNFLINKKSWEASKFNAQQLIKELWLTTIDIKDPTYNKGISELIAKLNALLEQSNQLNQKDANTNLDDLIASTRINYEAYRKDLNTRMETQRELIKSLSDLLSIEMHPSFNGFIELIKPYLSKATKSYEESDPDTSARNFAQLLKISTTFFLNFKEYSISLLEFFKEQTIYPAFVDNAEKELLKLTADRIINEINLSIVPTEEKAIVSMLKQLDAFQFSIENYVKTIAEKVLSIYQSIDEKATLDPEFMAVYDDWFNLLNIMKDNPDQKKSAKSYWKQQVLLSFDQTWSKLVKQASLSDSLESLSSTKPGSRQQTNFPKVEPTPINFSGRSELAQLEFEKAIKRSKLKWIFYSIIYTLILGLIMSLAAYNAQGSDFAGTCKELAALFLIAFSLDITLDNITKVGQKIN